MTTGTGSPSFSSEDSFIIDGGKMYDSKRNVIDLTKTEMAPINRALENSEHGDNLRAWTDGEYRLDTTQNRLVPSGSGSSST